MKTDKKTKEFLKNNPFLHVTLYHSHEIGLKQNNIEPPSDDTLITFEWPNGDEYNIKYSVLKNKAKQEEKKLIKQNEADNAKRME